MDVSTIFLPLHLITLLFVAWNVAHADHMGFTWMRGKVATLDIEIVKKYHKRVWIGIILMIVTGATLFYPMREFLLSRPQFYVKMGFVLALVINSFVIGNLSKIPTTRTFASLSIKEKLLLMISGAVSTLSWLGATLGGFFLIPD